MRFRYSHHARVRMTEQDIDPEMVNQVLAAPEQRVEGDTAHEFRAMVGRRLLNVVVSADPRTAIVITVFWVTE
ncbi:DUF4258 domain-containing protein [Candidatus Spongiisocius sp.]|uniref:DUF4258 domain-containing protein n=1 Tax=Candidatus Spongiisocius sp. TaxID=3101273 RepID=UPI003B5BFE7C